MKHAHQSVCAFARLAALSLLVTTGCAPDAPTPPTTAPADASLVTSSLAPQFVPDDYVPISTFKLPSVGPTVVLSVRPEILSWLKEQKATVLVARNTPNQGVVYEAPSQVDEAAGEVTYQPSGPGAVVVVSSALHNAYPIVTHWNQSLNEGRGGQEVGADDAIGLLDIDPDTQELTSDTSMLKNANPNHKHPASEGDDGLYVSATDKYAIYSDGSGKHVNAHTPAYERYSAENFSDVGVSDLRAIWFSDTVLQATGFPVVHTNGGELAGPNSLPSEVREDVPVFQLVHANIVRYDDPKIEGREDSLVAFLLPPGWNAAPAEPYPVLFNSFYGSHDTTFNPAIGPKKAIAIAQVLESHDARVVGMFHNGGGDATMTFNRSAYDNAAELFDQAKDLLGIDPHKIVMHGGSRGGTTALMLASNPYYDSYSVRYVLSSNAQTKPAVTIVGANPTYQLALQGSAQYVGYVHAWKPGWTLPGTEDVSVSDLWLEQLFGTTDSAHISDQLSPISERFLEALAKKSTKVVFHYATHDYSKPFSHGTAYVQQARDAGIPIQLNIHYRFGHGYPVNHGPDVIPLLVKVIEGDDSFDETTRHFRRVSAEEYTVGVEFTPSHMPLVVEAALAFSGEQLASLSFYGEPGTAYELYLPALSQTVPAIKGTLSSEANAGSGFAAAELPLSVAPVSAFTSYDYEVRYRVGGKWVTLSSGTAATPNWPDPIVAIMPEPTVGANDLSRTGGVCSDWQ